MGLGRWVGNAFAEGVNHISPLRLFQKEQVGKMAGGHAYRFIGPDAIRQRSSAIRDFNHSSGRGISDRFTDWWQGHDSALLASAGRDALAKSSFYKRAQTRNALYRRIALGAVAGATVLPAVTGDNLVTDAAKGATSLGIAIGGAGYFLNRGRLTGSKTMSALGYGIAGVSAVNFTRSGDQWGPG